METNGLRRLFHRSVFRTALLASVLAEPASAVSVQINSPSDGSTVSGTVEIAGTAKDLGGGQVSVSIDGGPFASVDGSTDWSFLWDTQPEPEGVYTVTARARECITCTPVTDSISVTVAPIEGPQVLFASPEEGAVVVDTLVVLGSSAGATEVTLSVNGDAERPANGLDPWSVVFEPGALAPGDHLLTARAVDDRGGEAFAELNITVGDPPAGTHDFVYASSVDGEPLEGIYYLPEGYDPEGEAVALVMHLHGGGGLGTISEAMADELDEKGWIGLSPDGRRWGLQDPDDPDSCPWQTSAGYVDHPDPNVGPGERDMLDALDWAQQTFHIDPDRIYLQGFSMGGRGTYMIGLKRPDLFAAIAPMGPAIDMYEVFVRRPEPAACKEGMVGGKPGDSPEVDTFYSITSGRFLIENAYNLPIFHGHGTLDTVANNTVTNAPFLHGWHILNDSTWDDCHDDLCFGHTPILDELQALHADDPTAYPWAYFFSEVGHQTDPRWLGGAEPESGDFGVVDPNDPSRLWGIYDFFDAHSRRRNPDTVVYKTYTDQHRSAYWVDILVSSPWQNTPGAVRAQKTAQERSLSVELTRVEAATFDLPSAELDLGPGQDLTVQLSRLREPGFDPALDSTDEPLRPTIHLRTDAGPDVVWIVTRDGQPITEVIYANGLLSIGPLTVTDPTELHIEPQTAAGPFFVDGFESGTAGAWQ